jgi:hypothetical protein
VEQEPLAGPIAALNANASVTPPNCANTPDPAIDALRTNPFGVAEGDRVREDRAEQRTDAR